MYEMRLAQADAIPQIGCSLEIAVGGRDFHGEAPCLQVVGTILHYRNAQRKVCATPNVPARTIGRSIGDMARP